VAQTSGRLRGRSAVPIDLTRLADRLDEIDVSNITSFEDLFKTELDSITDGAKHIEVGATRRVGDGSKHIFLA
jgi:hypothetical protein